MKDYSYDYDSETDYDDLYGAEMEQEKKRPMLNHVISLLQSLIGILDIISNSIRKQK